tara:strand:- start:1324 stop:1698 length:375 start_codon:yes stop_codon:yes gene_type:complete
MFKPKNSIFKNMNMMYIYGAIIAFLIILPLIINVVLFYTNHFEKEIVVKEKYTRYRKKASNYNIVDENGIIYKIDNVWFKGDFNRADEYAKIEENKKYKVKGYGIRLPILEMYYKIYDVKSISS